MIGKEKFYVGYEDEVSMVLADKNRRTAKLSRTHIKIQLKQDCESTLESCLWTFNALGESEASWELEWQEPLGFFRLKSLGQTPFIHNGVRSYDSLIRYNDHVDFSYHRVIFQKPQQKEYGISLPWNKWPEKAPIFLCGETGTGKSSLARMIHEVFHCPLKPFVHINLSAFTPTLIESELFGHEKGSFTGADRDKKGAIELAGNGTLFIDEVDSCSQEIQLKLLLFLDHKYYRRVGSEKQMKARCRLIFASSQSPYDCLHSENMRNDFYFRINSGLHYELKSLREDTSLITDFINNFEKENLVTVDRDLKSFLLTCPWPGNYRQLASYLNKKFLMEERSGRLSFGSLEGDLKQVLKATSQEDVIPLKEMRDNYCRRVFYQHKGSISDTARKLGIARNTLKSILSA
jgi:transcriptional regulator with AAA-type ATPase domain